MSHRTERRVREREKATRRSSLFVQQVSDPKDPLTLLNLDRLQVEAGTTLVKTDAVGEPDGCRDQEEGRL